MFRVLGVSEEILGVSEEIKEKSVGGARSVPRAGIILRGGTSILKPSSLLLTLGLLILT